MSVRTDTVNLNVNINGDSSKKELNDLRKRSADLRAELKGLHGNSARAKEIRADLKGIDSRILELKKSIGLTALSQKELTSELRRLQTLKNVATPQTKEYFELQKQIDLVSKRLKDVKAGTFGFKAALGSISKQAKEFALIGASYLGFEFITGQITNILSGAGKVSDKLADLQLKAGLTRREVDGLYQSLRKIDTRTSNSGLLDLAIIAAKLGIAKGDIKDFVEALDKLVVVMGDELGDADKVAEEIGKIINVYDKGAKVTGERATQIGNAVVALANSGVATGKYVVGFTQRLAGIANAADIALNSVMGLAAGFEELGQTEEVSSTAVTQIIGKIGTDVQKYAGLAGKSVQEFAQTLKDDPVEALLQLAEGLTKNKQGFAEIAVAFKDAEANGVRVTGTLATLGTKSDFFREKINIAGGALTNTTQITEGFRLKNENLGAVLDKIGKKIASSFTSKTAIDGLTSIALAFAEVIGAVEETNESLSRFYEEQKSFNDLEKSLVPLLNRYDELTERARTLGGVSRLSAQDQEELKKVIAKIGEELPYAALEFDKYGNAISISTEKAKEFIKYRKLLLEEKNREAIGDTKKTIDELEKAVAISEKQMEGLKKRYSSITIEEREARRKRNQYSPFAGDKKDIDESYPKIIAAGNEKINQLKARLQGQKAILAELKGEPIVPDSKVAETADAAHSKVEKTEQLIGDLRKEIQALEDALDKIPKKEKALIAANRARHKALTEELARLVGERTKEEKKSEAEQKRKEERLANFRLKLDKLQNEITAKAADLENDLFGKSTDQQEIAALINKYESLHKEAIELSADIAELDELSRQEFNNLVQAQFTRRSEHEYAQALKDLDAYFQQEKQAANAAYASGELSQEQHARRLKAIDTEEAKARITIAGDYSKNVKKAAEDTERFKTAATQQGVEDRKILDSEEEENRIARARLKLLKTRPGSLNELEAKKNLLREEFELEKKHLGDRHDLILLAETEFKEKIATLDREYAQAKANEALNVLRDTASILDQVFAMERAKDQRVIAEQERGNERKKRNYQRLVDNRLMTEEEAAERTRIMDEQLEAKKVAMQKREATRKKAMAIYNATIDIAQAIISALNTQPVFLGIAMATTVAAMAGLQLANIENTDVPVGRKGLVVQGASHEEQGIDLIERKSGRTLANIEGGEPVMVLSRETYGNNREVIDELIYNSQYKNGARVRAAGWYDRRPSVLNTPEIIPVMRNGGTTGTGSTAYIPMPDSSVPLNELPALMRNMIREQAETREVLNRWPVNTRSYVVLKDLNEATDLLNKAKSAAGLRQ